MMTDEQSPRSGGYWNELGARYLAIPPPLRLAPEDRRRYWRQLSKHHALDAPPRVLVLGATPDFYEMSWPQGTELLAVDRSEAMLRAIWPGPEEQTLCQDWAGLDLPRGSRNVVLCDGGLTLLRFPDQLLDLADALKRILVPNGLFVVRMFVEGEKSESVDEIVEDYVNGRIENSSVLKVRLWGAMHGREEGGVRLHDIWERFEQALQERRASQLDAVTSAPPSSGLDGYKDMNDRYFMPTVEEVRGLLCENPGGFECLDIETPTYENAEHVRLVTFRRL